MDESYSDVKSETKYLNEESGTSVANKIVDLCNKLASENSHETKKDETKPVTEAEGVGATILASGVVTAILLALGAAGSEIMDAISDVLIFSMFESEDDNNSKIETIKNKIDDIKNNIDSKLDKITSQYNIKMTPEEKNISEEIVKTIVDRMSDKLLTK